MNYKYKKGQIFGKRLKVPGPILARIHNSMLSFQEFMDYDLEGKVPPLEVLREEDRKILERFGLEKCKKLDWDLLDTRIYYTDLVIKDVVLTIDPNVEDINLALYDLVKDSLNPEDFSPMMRENCQDYYMEKIEDATPYENDLVTYYNMGRLDLIRIIKNWDLFKNKNLTNCLSKDRYNTHHITDALLRDFISKYQSLIQIIIERGDIYEFISEISNLEEEKRFEYIKNFTDRLLEKESKEQRNFLHFGVPAQLSNDEYREIFKYSSIEEFFKSIDQYRYNDLLEELKTLPEDYLYNIHIPISVLANRNVLLFVNEFGLKNIVDFDNECGYFFSNNDFEVLKSMYDLYLHYPSGFDSERTFYTKNNREGSKEGTYTKEEFYEAIKRKILHGPTDGTLVSKAPDYRAITGEFRTKNKNLFIDEKAPEELQNLFYTKVITPTIIANHPEYIEFLRGKNLSSCFKSREVSVGEERGYSEYKNFYTFFEEKLGFDTTMSFITEYCEVLDVVYDWTLRNSYNLDITYSENDDLFKMKERINEKYMKIFSKGELKFPKRIPQSLKDAYPNCFLPDSVDEEIRDKFYNRELSVIDFEKHPEWVNFFDKTNLLYGFPIEMSWMISLFDDIDNMKLANLDRLKVLVAYSKIQDVSLQKAFKEYFLNPSNEINLEKLEYVADVLTRLSLSNSSEIFAFRKELATQILNSDDPIETLNKIEDLFIRNNIPTVGKIYSCFEILHPDFIGFNFESSMVSPVLKRSSTTTKKVIVFSDLIKATLGSNNRSVNFYINNIEYGSIMFEKIKNHEIEFDSLTEMDKRELRTFSKHLITMYNTSLMAKRANSYYDSTDDVIKDIMEVAKLISPNGGLDYNLGDRIIRMFCGFSGIDTIEQAKGYIRTKVRYADKRNREAASHNMILEPGDFVKGIGGVTYLRNILQNGSVSKEFLGSSAGSDATPLDTDLSMVLESSGDIESRINATEANSYGPIWFVLKRNDRFQTTRTIDGDLDSKRDLSKLEVFYTGAVGNGHYGIRTGFASSEIDYIVMESYDARVGLEIAMNGFYIPIANKQGKIIFTPKDYDELRAKMSGLSYYGEDEYKFSDSIITPDIEVLASQIEQSNIEVNQKRAMINENIRKSLEEIGLKLKTSIDGDLSPGYVELIDTGSTGRGTNKPGDGDFDFMMRLDKSILSNPQKLEELKQTLLKNLRRTGVGTTITGNGDFRLKDVPIGPNTFVDIDITFTEKTDKVTYSTDMALQDRLSTIQRNNPKKYKYVVANILLAKQVLKAAGVYKPNRGEVPQGGLGGVGIENWILQHGGSFIEAATSFIQASEGRTFQEFQQVYRVWDFGENHLAERIGHYSHDNFVTGNMSEEGYKKMCEALRKYLSMTYKEEKESTSTLK